MTRRHTIPRCEVSGCGARRAPLAAFCGRCWLRLTPARRAEMDAAKDAGEFMRWSGLVREATAWLEEHAPAIEAAKRIGEPPG